jgi:cysteine desulfuration protein SufE
MSINSVQDEIIAEISTLNGDIEKILFYIISLGSILPAMPKTLKVDNNLIQGCHSNVWLVGISKSDRVDFYADSDTAISKGLVSLLVRIFNGRPVEEIINANIYFNQKNHLERFIGTKRSNGFAAMIDRIKEIVQALPPGPLQGRTLSL